MGDLCLRYQLSSCSMQDLVSAFIATRNACFDRQYILADELTRYQEVHIIAHKTDGKIL